jgi:hypothetical protein
MLIWKEDEVTDFDQRYAVLRKEEEEEEDPEE